MSAHVPKLRMSLLGVLVVSMLSLLTARNHDTQRRTRLKQRLLVGQRIERVRNRVSRGCSTMTSK
jgi:hypothetical protein